MKKILLLIVSVAALSFAGCSKVETKNEFGWFTDYNACLKSAQKENKNVMLVISRDEADGMSSTLKENIFHTEEFADMFYSDFEFCELDVSPSLVKKSYAGEDASREEIREAKQYKKIVDDRMRLCSILSIQVTPTLYLLTKEGYVIQDVPYLPVTDVNSFSELLAQYKPEIENLENLVEAVSLAKGKDKVLAIDNLYENCNKTYRYQLTDLMRQVEKLDSKNETGLLGKYILAIGTSDSMDAYFNRKPESVPGIYEKVAEHWSLTPEQKQQAYYAAAYIIGSNAPSPEVAEKLIDILQKIIDIDETSSFGKIAARSLEQVKDFKQRQEETERQMEEESQEPSEEETAKN